MNKTTLDNINIFIRSILAGICIGLGGAILPRSIGVPSL